ncbi:MAG: hypothetical protein HRU09_19935 [Oligoflexales bacterium]|nr:hypothetical protein [Oligoflexales bacterium]
MKLGSLIKPLKVVCCASLFLSLLVACGYKEKGAVKKDWPLTQKLKSDMVPISVELVSELEGLNLHSAYQYNFSIDGCDSGYSIDFDESQDEIMVFESDTNCIAKLNAFKINGVSFNPEEPFLSWKTGEVALYTSSQNPEHKLQMSIVSQLGSPLKSSDKIIFKFRELEVKEGIEYATAGLKNSQSLEFLGNHAPPYELTHMLVTKKKKGQISFKVHFNCLSAMDNRQSEVSCEGQNLKDLKYALANEGSIETVDFESVEEQFALDSRSKKEFFQDESYAPNGGFTIKLKFSLKEIVAKSKYLLFLKNDEDSFSIHHISFE